MKRHVTLFGHGALACALWLVPAAGAGAASLSVLPVRVQLGAKTPIVALTVRNESGEATTVQLHAMQWTQVDGVDRYEPTREVLATPPIFTIAPGGSQIVRVGLRRAPDPTRELSYRLFLQEVPPAPAPGFTGMQVTLRFSLPVFVAAAAPARPALRWQARLQDGATVLSALNDSDSHVEITQLDLADAGSRNPLQSGAVQNYLLPGQRHEWRITARPATSMLHVSARTDAGAQQADVPLAAD